jgi:hypothetical protein
MALSQQIKDKIIADASRYCSDGKVNANIEHEGIVYDYMAIIDRNVDVKHYPDSPPEYSGYVGFYVVVDWTDEMDEVQSEIFEMVEDVE